MAAGSGREDFKMTQDEANRLVEALKKEEFRKLLAEYAEEISNPENKRLYEEEIAKLEQERGVDVKFIHPTPGHVLKTCLVPSKKKVFINICCCDLIEPAMPNEREIGATKTMWSIPYSLTPAREDVDKANNRITIFDAIFNPATYKKGKEMPKFCDLIEATALDGIEKDLKVNIDRKHIKRLKQPYKGNPHPTVIRKRTDKKTPEPIGHLKVPYPPLQEEDTNKRKPKTSDGPRNDPTEPKYSIVYSGDFDCQDFTYNLTNSKRPTRIIITIELPKLTTAAKLDVDIYEKLVILHNSDPLYHLELPLAYPVDEDNGVAKFHKQNKSLVLTLQVIPLPIKNHTTLPSSVQDDVNGLENNDEVSGTENTSIDEESTGEEKLDQINTTSEPCTVKSDWSVMEQWQCPPFSFNQENDIISFVLHVSQVKGSTITYHIDTNSAQITFRSTGAYSFYVSFHEDCRLISNESGFSVSDDNVVLRLKKKDFENKEDNHDWESFYFGINSSQTEKKDFLNENSLVDIIQYAHYPDPWHTSSLSTQVSALVNNDKATVTLSTEEKCVQAQDDDTQDYVENPLPTVIANDDKTTVTLSTEGECVDDDRQGNAEKGTVLLEEEKKAKEEKPIIIKESIPTFSNTLIFDLD